MSMGYENNNYSRNYGGNDKKDGVKEPTTYSEVRFSNPTSTVDATALKFKFMYGLLNIAISPKKNESTPNGEMVKWDYNNSIDIWISYNHAYILQSEIRRLLEVNDPSKLKFVGVPTKKDVIVNFGFGTDFGTENFVLIIAKIAGDGSIEKSYIYEFDNSAYSSIVNFDMNTKKFEKNIIPNLEIEMMLTLLDEYIKSANGAAAYMNRFYNRFDSSRKYDMLVGLCEKNNVVINNKANYSNSRGNGFFEGNGGASDSFNGMNTPVNNNGFRESSLGDMSDYDID